MPSAALLPIDDLLRPIPGDLPAGDTVPFSIRQKMEEMRKEINPADFAPDDPRRPDEPKRADWPGIINLGQKTLREVSKDLQVAARVTEALTKQHGFAGLRDGLALMRRLIDECWDRVNPSIEDGDLEVRAAPFNWLDDPDRGARFPTTVRMAPIVLLEGEGYGWHHWKQAQDGKGGMSPEVFEKAVLMTPREYAQTVVEDLEAAEAELHQLIATLTLRLESVAPSMLALGEAVQQSLTLAREVLRRKGPGEEAAPEETTEATAVETTAGEPASVAAGLPRRPRTRAEVYQQLHEAAMMLQQMEPHSPVPYLILKAVEWGALPFPQLIRALVRDENIIVEMNRELGIKEQQPPQQS